MIPEISQEQKYLNAITRLKHIKLELETVESSLDFDSYAVNSIKSSTLNALDQVRSKLCELRGE
jgi:hypothetical protein